MDSLLPELQAETRMTSALQMKPFELDDWRQLPKVGRHVGNIGAHTSVLWEWIHTYSIQSSRQEFDVSQGLQHSKQDQDSMGKGNKSRVAWSLAQSWPLARHSPWPVITTQQR
jgi:hypothetical protein